MANQEISLKWNGYQSNILSNVKELLRDEGLSDVTLVSEGHSLKAHKVILSANSLVFRTIFQQNPHKDPIIVLHDINTASLRTLLSFMYNGEVNVTEELLPMLLKTAETLKICGLSANCETTKEQEKAAANEPKKRKRSEQEDNNIKVKKPTLSVPKLDMPDLSTKTNPAKLCIQSVKEEPIDSPLTDYSGENTDDTDIALLDDMLEKKYPVSPESLSNKSVRTTVSSELNVKKWVSEVSSTQPAYNNCNGKANSDIKVIDDDKDSIEIDKEVETVLQSGAIVESLNITTENLNAVSSLAHKCSDKNLNYSNPLFPCPFCSRVYNSWGYRRRHVKSRHLTNKLSCKWCVSVLPSTSAWYSHATRAHAVSHDEARNSLVVMVEAHAVLTLAEPSAAQLLGQVGISENTNATNTNTDANMDTTRNK